MCFCNLYCDTNYLHRGKDNEYGLTMIDLSKIRSIKTLEEMKKDLEFFINEPVIREIYIVDNEWGEDDLEADRDSAKELIDLIDKRVHSLNRIKINPPKAKQEKRLYKKSEPKETADGVQSSEEHAHGPCTSSDNNSHEASPSQ